MIETMAINELELRRQRLEEYQVKARFAMAESYDRATKARQDKLEQELQQKHIQDKEQSEDTGPKQPVTESQTKAVSENTEQAVQKESVAQ
jgi:hypothetical protein